MIRSAVIVAHTIIVAGTIAVIAGCSSNDGRSPASAFGGTGNGAVSAEQAGATAVGQGGAANKTARSQVSGGSGGTETTSSASTLTKYGACVAYVSAVCKRRFEDCGERTYYETPCTYSLDRCPDLLFATGSSWTVESLKACMADWQQFSCDGIRKHQAPSCAGPAGNNPLGAPCLFDIQCASRSCVHTNSDGSNTSEIASCGACGEASNLGGLCDIAGRQCGPGLICRSGKCDALPAVGILGEPCIDGSTCGDYGVSCRTDITTGTKRCQLLPAAGESCAEATCRDGYICGNALQCVAAAGSGMTCGPRGTTQCGEGLVCGSIGGADGTCSTGGKLGQTCLGDRQHQPRGNCELGLRCDCGQLDCEDVPGTCVREAAEGEPCTDPQSKCAWGTQCLDGKCVALDAQTGLTGLCKP